MEPIEVNGVKKIGLKALFTGLVPLFALAHFGHHLLTALPIPLLPMIRDDFALDYTQSGLLISAFAISYGIGQLPAGWLADRVGRRIVVTVGICGVALAGLLIGLSQTYLMLIFLLALMGLLGGAYHPASTPLLSTLVEPKRRGSALGVHMIGGSASYFLAPLIAAGFAAIWGWRSPFLVLAIPTFLFGVTFYWLLGRRITPKKPEPEAVTIQDKTQTTYSRLPRLIPFLVLSAFTSAITFSVVSFVPLFIVDRFGVAEEQAAAFIAIFYSAGLWASLTGGYLSDRLGRLPVFLAVTFIAGPMVYLLSLVSFGLGIGAVLLILGALQYMRMPVAESYLIGQTPERKRSTMLGIYYFGSMEGTGILTPVLGYLIDQFGFQVSFAIAGVFLFAVTIIGSIFLWSRRSKL